MEPFPPRKTPAGGRVLVLDADATRRFDPGTVDAMVLRCDGETILLFVWRERFDWGGSIRSNCPGSIGPLDTATLARRPIEPFRAGKVRIFWRERLDSMFLEHKSFAYGQGLSYFFFPLSARGPTRRRNSTGLLAELSGGWPIEPGIIVRMVP